ncbi:hypothetical protein U9R90_26130 [Streptomyces sp. E11-3]|uniref:hypothetical protein n=1 Tax=Streptomyces sp. E11-3 TaxID=3110112 RepID=UPI00398116D5
MTDTRSPMRALRAALFAAVCVTLAGVGHSSMSGHALPIGSLLAAFGVTLGVAWLAGGRRRGAWSIGGVLLGAQGALHLIFSMGQAHAASHAPPHGARHHGDDGVPGAHGDYAAQSTAVDTMGHASTGMLAAHLLAAVVCALWLARGEAAFFGLLRALRTLARTPLRLLLAVVRVPSVPGPVRMPRPGRGGARPRIADLAHVVSRRGPPTGAVPLPRYAPTAL